MTDELPSAQEEVTKPAHSAKTSCPDCGALAEGSFCSQCGTPLATLAPPPEPGDVGPYTADGRCRHCDKLVASDARALHPRYCAARPTEEVAANAEVPQGAVPLRHQRSAPPVPRDPSVGGAHMRPRGAQDVAMPAPVASTSASPGWYPDPAAPGQRWWDGQQWGARAPGLQSQYVQPAVLPPSEKSSGVALLLTILWPGAGHLYLGLNSKAIPYVVANAIGFVVAMTGILFFVGLIIWIITLVMLVGGVTDDTERVNAALRQGTKIVG